MLRFERKDPDIRMARGLSNDSAQTLHHAYSGQFRVGYYFRIGPEAKQCWRWHSDIAQDPDEASGYCGSQLEAQAILNEQFNLMLRLSGLTAKRGHVPAARRRLRA